MRRTAVVTAGVSVALLTFLHGTPAPATAAPASAPATKCLQVSAKQAKQFENGKLNTNATCITYTMTTTPKVAAKPLTTDPNANIAIAASMPAVADQGDSPTCTAWAIGYGLAGYYLNKAGVAAKPDTYRLFAESKRYAREVYGQEYDPTNTMGLYSGDAYKALVKGIPTVTASIKQTVDWWTPWSADETTKAATYRLQPPVWLRGGDGDFVTDPDLKARIISELDAGHPVAAAFSMGEEIMEPYDAPIDEIVAAKDSADGEPYIHAMLIIGYKSDGILVQNSWGKSWSEDGRIWLKWDYALSRILDASTSYGLASS